MSLRVSGHYPADVDYPEQNSSIYPSIHPLLAAAPDVFNESLYAERAAIAIMVMQPLRPRPRRRR